MLILNVKFNSPKENATEFMEEHKAFRDKYYDLNKFICSGKLTKGDGGIILCNSNMEEIYKILNDDPLYRNNIVNYEITEFELNNCLDDFTACLF
ncbi:MAG: YciI family protein [Sarcina sp.]